jgi:hypothetical protein
MDIQNPYDDEFPEFIPKALRASLLLPVSASPTISASRTEPTSPIFSSPNTSQRIEEETLLSTLRAVPKSKSPDLSGVD